VENGCFWSAKLAPEQRYFKFANQSYLQYSADMGWIPEAKQIVLQIYSEPLQKFRLAAQGHGPHQPPDIHRERIETHFDPLPIWYPPFEESHSDDSTYPLHALTQRPMAMYHSWGSQNVWLRQIHGWNKLYVHADTAREAGIADDD